MNISTGYTKISTKDIIFEEKELFRIPGYDPSKDYELYKVAGDAMCPTLLPEEIIICQKLSTAEKLQKGDLALFSRGGQWQAKRILIDTDPDYVLLQNDNSAASDLQRIKKSELGKILIVRGKLSNSLTPHHQLVSKGKIQVLKETLIELERELFRASNKLNKLTRNKVSK